MLSLSAEAKKKNKFNKPEKKNYILYTKQKQKKKIKCFKKAGSTPNLDVDSCIYGVQSRMTNNRA